ncbi:MAG: hypothetical protein KatS3mg110_3951 [Pirellulaceae bacterium]|nr:MAG: hypothetical protein KatS3mg110_3951 [Pirellulaceae bacterium]
MIKAVALPPDAPLLPDGSKPGGWWRELEDGRLLCELCPRACRLREGDRGFCFVRQNVGGQIVLTTYGRSTGFCIDPIEKKPLNHFYPGTSVLSFGTAGCNLGCKFCQNWDISKSREIERLSETAMPDAIVAAAKRYRCHSVAFTYNDPVIWAEYAIDTARLCRAEGIKTVAVTAGYITREARAAFYEYMDAANVDLKGFTEDFYQHYTLSHLQPVLDTLEWLKKETNVWFEITNLVIPRANDTPDEIRRMCQWILERVGDDVPLHFTAFHPDFRLLDRPHTPKSTLLMAYEIARQEGIKYVYIGNVDDWDHQSTYCHGCGRKIIGRNWYELREYHLDGNRCAFCGTVIPGRFGDRPGDWGRRRMPVRIADFRVPQLVSLNAQPAGQAAPKSPSTPRKHPSSTAEKTTNATKDRPMTNNLSTRPLTDEQERAVLRAACELVAAEIAARQVVWEDPTLAGAARLPVEGLFVTLKRSGKLRACCGTLGRRLDLFSALRQAAARAAKDDVRLPMIGLSELPHLHVEVTLLYRFELLPGDAEQRRQAIEIGRHGLSLHYQDHAGLLLPQVPVEHGWDVPEFLEHVCIKAGVPRDAWKAPEAELYRFEGYRVEGEFDAEVARLIQSLRPYGFPAEQLADLARLVRDNVLAHLCGGTPTYYLLHIPDRTVHGVAARLRADEVPAVWWAQLSTRPGLPLQATLYQASQALADQCARVGQNRVGDTSADVVILEDLQTHGTVENPDLAGFDPAKRMLVVLAGNDWHGVFDPSRATAALLDVVCEQAAVTRPAAAQLMSFEVSATTQPIELSSSPQKLSQPEPVADRRRPAVAGMFYPGTAQAVARQLDELAPRDPAPRRPWPAAMVPHAGWVYSGRIAAQVWSRLEPPGPVIILCPKHTRFGHRWAVAPHSQWEFPGGVVEADTALAKRLAERVPGWELDADAHAKEHAIEVELPILHYFHPHTRVVGVAIGPCSYEQAAEFAESLAEVVEQWEPRPTLVISSDLNHYASDEENRRLDRLALDAMASLDPRRLYDTVREHGISMCGILPAVIVMETLRRAGRLHQYEEVAYGTSGDAFGERSRVVGYAGVLLG